MKTTDYTDVSTHTQTRTHTHTVSKLTAEISCWLSADFCTKQSFIFRRVFSAFLLPSQRDNICVCVSVCILLACMCVYLCCFGPMGDCYHCCVKQIRELGWFGRITTLDFWTTLTTRYVVYCIPVRVHMREGTQTHATHTYHWDYHTHRHTHIHMHILTHLQLEYTLVKHNVAVGWFWKTSDYIQ